MGVILRNLCPHPVKLPELGVTIDPSGPAARINEAHHQGEPLMVEHDGTVVEVPRNLIVLGEVSNLPEPEEGVVYIVSKQLAAALPHRRDLVFPDGVVRDANGTPSGCQRLSQIKA